MVPPTPGMARAAASAAMTEEDEDAMWDEMIEAELRASPIIRRRKLEVVSKVPAALRLPQPRGNLQPLVQQLQQQRRAECGGAVGGQGGSGSQDTLDDSSSDLAEPPYRSLSSSCELHRYGTLNSLPDGLAAEEDLSALKDKDDAEPDDAQADKDDEDQDEDDKQSGKQHN